MKKAGNDAGLRVSTNATLADQSFVQTRSTVRYLRF